MKAQLWPRRDGMYNAEFMFDDAPPGFEDLFGDSTFVHRLNRGVAYAEYGHPDIQHLVNHPDQALVRYSTIDERQIAGHLTAETIYKHGLPAVEGFLLIFKPCGPMGHIAVASMNENMAGWGLGIRMLKDPNEDMDNEIKVIITADFVQL